MKVGDWIVGQMENRNWTYPGKVMAVNDQYVVFEIQDVGGAYEIHRHPEDVRAATKQDFDRQILDLSRDLVSGEALISTLEGIQKDV